jgi:selenocysteine-specific elongation factor
MANLIGTAGHVDHGKTTLIRALTGIDTDRLPEEKKRGLTIDVGFAYVDLPEVGRVSIIDVPGHEKFVTNMLVGALGIDVALLCVAADESVMPQTIEHFQIIELLPVDRMVVALTRSDLVDETTLEIAREEVLELLAPTRFKESPIVPVSAFTGAGLDDLKGELTRALKEQEGDASGPWYMPIDRAFAVKGHGVVVTGTLAQGAVNEGDQAVLMPDNVQTRVRSVHSHDVPQKTSVKGKRTALNLGGVKLEEVHRGQVIGSPGVVFDTSVVDAHLRWLRPPRHGARVRVSIGADEGIARVFLNDNDPSLAQLRFERPVAAAKGQPLIVRRYSPPDLLGGGRVTIPQARERKKKDLPTPVASKEAPIQDEIIGHVASSSEGLINDELCRLVGKSPQALGDTLEQLKGSGQLLGFAGLWMTRNQFIALSDRLLDALSAIHTAEPTTLFQPREKALNKAGLGWKGKPLDRIVSYLVETDKLRSQGTTIARSDFKVKFSDKQQALLDKVMAELLAAGLSVPNPEEIARKLNLPKQAVEEIVRIGTAAGELVRIEDGIYLPIQTIEQTKAKMQTVLKDKQFSASEFREAFGTTRKYAIPILEYLDARGVTKRLGDVRVLA